MNPAFSIVAFTLLVGMAQGLVVVAALATLADAVDAGFVRSALAVAAGLLVAGLAASFLHLGRKLRAWRAVTMWRTSWMSREVIVLPAFIALVGAWWAAPAAWSTALAWIALPLALLLWLCTAMIYACLRFVQEWAHPLTVVNFTLIGLASGCVLAGALALAHGTPAVAQRLAPWALAATLAAAAGRVAALRRNVRLVALSTPQSATGIRNPQVVQTSMGMTGGSFNTREFFHRAPPVLFRAIRFNALACGFVLPAVLLAWAVGGGGAAAWWLALVLQTAGLVAERWFFFAEARHPQNIYYQRVS